MIDTAGAMLVLIASVLTTASLIFSSRYFDTVGTLFHCLMLIFLGAMNGFAQTGDLFNLFVFFELMSAAAYALCGYKSEEPGPIQGALNFAVTNTVGAFLVLTGIAPALQPHGRAEPRANRTRARTAARTRWWRRRSRSSSAASW